MMMEYLISIKQGIIFKMPTIMLKEQRKQMKGLILIMFWYIEHKKNNDSWLWWFLTNDNFDPRRHQECLKTFLFVTIGEVLLLSNVRKPGVLLNILQQTDKPPLRKEFTRVHSVNSTEIEKSWLMQMNSVYEHTLKRERLHQCKDRYLHAKRSLRLMHVLKSLKFFS